MKDKGVLKMYLFNKRIISVIVIIMAIIFGWPGGPQFLPASAIGLVSNHIEASEVIWEHFQRHTLPVEREPVTWFYILIAGLLILALVLGTTKVLRVRAQQKSAIKR